MKDLLQEIGSCDYGGGEVPQSLIWKLENEEDGGVIQSESEGL